MHLFIVRHGRTATNVRFVPGTIRPITEPIDETGLLQVQEAAEMIAHSPYSPELIITSPYIRALQTAQIIANTLHVPIEHNDGLRENSIGDWEGIGLKDLHARFDKIPTEQHYNFVPPSGESWLDAAHRFMTVINDAKARGFTAVVLVSHESPIRSVMSELTDVPYEEWDGVTSYAPGSVTEFDY